MLPNGRQTNATRDHGCRLSGDKKRSFWRAVKRIKSGSPLFFEHLVVELLVAMGYGGSRKDAGEAVGGRGDGGLTASSKRTDWVWMPSICRPRDGRELWAGRWCRPLPGCLKRRRYHQRRMQE